MTRTQHPSEFESPDKRTYHPERYKSKKKKIKMAKKSRYEVEIEDIVRKIKERESMEKLLGRYVSDKEVRLHRRKRFDKLYRESHREKIRKRKKIYYMENKEEISRKNAIHYQANREKIIKQTLEYQRKKREERNGINKKS